jgi:hypothetical protein
MAALPLVSSMLSRFKLAFDPKIGGDKSILLLESNAK